MDNATDLALIAIVATVVGGMFKLLAANTLAFTKVADASDRVAKETAQGNREAKERNGHLGEQNIQITELITRQNKDLASMRKTGEANAKATERAVKVLEQTATTLAKNTQMQATATEKVAKTLKENTLKEQRVTEQTVWHQTVNNPMEDNQE